jgi:hypothetical protein
MRPNWVGRKKTNNNEISQKNHRVNLMLRDAPVFLFNGWLHYRFTSFFIAGDVRFPASESKCRLFTGC